MLLKSPISIAPASGFVAFDGGGAIDVDSYVSHVTARAPIAQPAMPVAMPVPATEAADGMRQTATWQPAQSVRNRRVEGAVILAICAYFVFGFAGLVHWI